jgi:hypothetical protein
MLALGVLVLVPSCRINLDRRWNQKEALSSLKTIREAERSFKVKKEDGKYGTLVELGAAELIDPSLASGIKDGYRFEVRIKGNSFEAIAVPIKYLETGIMSLYLDETGVIRYGDKKGGEANANDSPIDSQ